MIVSHADRLKLLFEEITRLNSMGEFHNARLLVVEHNTVLTEMRNASLEGPPPSSSPWHTLDRMPGYVYEWLDAIVIYVLTAVPGDTHDRVSIHGIVLESKKPHIPEGSVVNCDGSDKEWRLLL